MAKKGSTRIHVEFLDGRTFDATSTTHMCQADRYAFERHFSTGAGVLVGLGDLFEEKKDDAGEVMKNDAGEAQVTIAEGRDGGEFHETHLGFFAWRALTREVRELAEMSFDDFAGQVAELVVKDDKDGDTDRVDPQKATSSAPPG